MNIHAEDASWQRRECYFLAGLEYHVCYLSKRAATTVASYPPLISELP